jgi:iron complex transport system permease protein
MYLELRGIQGTFSFSDLWSSIFSFNANETEQLILREIRIPRILAGILAGAALSLAGNLMQTLFQNPLAGPSVLGISSGASLFVALSMLSGFSVAFSDWALVSMALLGAFLYSLIILFFSGFVRSHVSLLLVGIMLGGFTNALVQIIQVSTHATNLKAFTLWGFGSIQQVNFAQLPFLSAWIALGIALLVLILKPLQILVLGEVSSKQLGINTKVLRMVIIFITALLTGVVTAYCGPISFIGLAVPNVVRILYRSQNQKHVLLGCMIYGAALLLLCDYLVLLCEPYFMLPLNGITALIGSPLVVWIILRKG